jgi:hypothetical protein
MKSIVFKVLFLSVVLFGSQVQAQQQRHIHLNGEHLSDQIILQLDTLVGSTVQDGYYWLNLQTGQWGYEGNDQIQGIVAAIAQQNQPQNSSTAQAESRHYKSYEGVSSTGTVTSGKLNGQNCTFVSVGGSTMKSCD